MYDNKTLGCTGTKKTGALSPVPARKSLLHWDPQFLRVGGRETSMAAANLRKNEESGSNGEVKRTIHFQKYLLLPYSVPG